LEPWLSYFPLKIDLFAKLRKAYGLCTITGLFFGSLQHYDGDDEQPLQEAADGDALRQPGEGPAVGDAYGTQPTREEHDSDRDKGVRPQPAPVPAAGEPETQQQHGEHCGQRAEAGEDNMNQPRAGDAPGHPFSPLGKEQGEDAEDALRGQDQRTQSARSLCLALAVFIHTLKHSEGKNDGQEVVESKQRIEHRLVWRPARDQVAYRLPNMTITRPYRPAQDDSKNIDQRRENSAE
jgi:hypothetical protein